MLDFFRRSATSVVSWVILGVLALAFGLSFGLPSDSISFGATPFVSVRGAAIGDAEVRYQFNAVGRVAPLPESAATRRFFNVNGIVLDAAVERALLADVARRLGLEATVADAEDLTLNGHVVILGDTFRFLPEGQAFDYERFREGWLRELQISEKDYLEIQRDEVLARTLRELLASAVTVADDELRREYDRRADRVDVTYVRFDPLAFAPLVDADPAAIDGWLGAHRDELEAEYTRQAARFAKLPEQTRLRLVEVAFAAAPAGSAAPAVDAAAPAAAEVPAPALDRDGAKARIDAARARIAGGEDLRAVARELSTHRTARAGGDYGWVSLSGTGSGLPTAVDDAARALAPGELSPVLEADGAYYLVRVDGRRQGDVPKDDALRELAEDAVAVARGRDLAQQAAKDALLGLADGSPLMTAFPPPSGESGGAGGAVTFAQTTGPFPRVGGVPGLGDAPKLQEAAFAAASPEPGATTPLGEVFEVGDAFVVAAVSARERPTDEGFAAERPDLLTRVREDKARKVLSRWSAQRCELALGARAIVPNADKITRLTTYDVAADEAESPAMKYSVCSRVGMRGDILRTQLLTQQMMGGMGGPGAAPPAGP